MLFNGSGVLISSGWGMDTQLTFPKNNHIMYIEFIFPHTIMLVLYGQLAGGQYLSNLQSCQGKANLPKRTPSNIFEPAIGIFLWSMICVMNLWCFWSIKFFQSWICFNILYYVTAFGNKIVFWRILEQIGIGKNNVLIQSSTSRHLFVSMISTLSMWISFLQSVGFKWV